EGVGDLVAQDAFDEVEVVIDQGGRLGRGRARLDVGPEVEEEAEVAAQLLFAGALGGGAHDEAAGSLAFFAEQDFLQAAAFGVGLDFARDAGVVDRGHEDQEAAGECDVRGNARALLGDGLLGDLDQNLLPGLEQIADDGQIGGLHGHAAAAVTMATAATAAAIAVAALGTPGIAPPAPAVRRTAAAAAGLLRKVLFRVAGLVCAGAVVDLIGALALFVVVLFQIIFLEVVFLVFLFFRLRRCACDVVDGHIA